MPYASVIDRFSALRGNHQELGVVEPFWEAQLAVLVTVLLYVALPPSLSTSGETLTIEESMNLEGENGSTER